MENLEKDRERARKVFAEFKALGDSDEDSAQAVWQDLQPRRARRRARFWDEATGPVNTGLRRNFICPLGQELQIQGATKPFGQFCSKWPRTVASREAARIIRELVLAFLRGEP